jgi:hypothetical protein
MLQAEALRSPAAAEPAALALLAAAAEPVVLVLLAAAAEPAALVLLAAAAEPAALVLLAAAAEPAAVPGAANHTTGRTLPFEESTPRTADMAYLRPPVLLRRMPRAFV